MTTAAAAQPAFVSPVNDTEIVMLRQWCGEFSTDQHKYYYEISGFLYRQGFAAYALPQLARIAASRLSQVFPRVVMDEIVDNLIDGESWLLPGPYWFAWHPNAGDAVLPFDPGNLYTGCFEPNHQAWCQHREVFFLRQYVEFLADHVGTVLQPLWLHERLLSEASTSSVRAFVLSINMTPRHL